MGRLLRLGLCLLVLAAPLSASAEGPVQGETNDPRAVSQWHIDQIGLRCAWEHTAGSANVTVAVIDSGVDPNHPDLVDILRTDGYNSVDENSDASDLNGHGTHVAGIIAAVVNNGEGVAGVAGNGTKILPIRVMDAEGSGTNRDIIQGIRYAIEKDVQIINMSLGSLLPMESEDIVAAIKEAHDAGILVVLAAGNSYVPLPNFAFGIEEVALVVAATDPEDKKTDFSNYGPWIAVSAPGYEILSTMPTYDVFMTSDFLPPEQRFRNNYDTMSGTSQATPVVAGLAALLFAQHPDWTADQVKEEIQRTATDISDLNPAKRFGPVTYFDPSHMGTGRVNACDALGGPIAGSNAPTGFSGGTNWLAYGIIGAGVVLLLGGMLVLFRRRKQPQRVVVPMGGPAMGGPMQQPGPQGYAPPQQPGPQSYAPPQQSGPQSYAPPAAPGASAAPAWGKLTVLEGPESGKFSVLRGQSAIIGRSADATLALSNDAAVSRQHVRITRDSGGVSVEDLGSSHGTLLNGAPLKGAQRLTAGSVLQLGHSKVRYDG